MLEQAAIGAGILVLVASFKISSPAGRLLSVLFLLAGFVVAQFFLSSHIRGSNLVSDVGTVRVAAGEGRILVDRLEEPPRNLIILTGSSISRQGIDPDFIENRLRADGFDVAIVKLAVGGATHFERDMMHEVFVRHFFDLEALPDETRVIFLDEVDESYDASPIGRLDRTFGTDRGYSFITPRTALAINRSFSALDAADGPNAPDLTWYRWEITMHAMANALNVGTRGRLVPMEEITGTYGTRIMARDYDGPLRDMDRLLTALDNEPPAFRRRYHWYPELLEDRYARLYSDLPDTHRAWVVPPTRFARRGRFAQSFCASEYGEAYPCLNAYSDREFISSLVDYSFWADHQHVNQAGAERYSAWLADQLAEAGLLQR